MRPHMFLEQDDLDSLSEKPMIAEKNPAFKSWQWFNCALATGLSCGEYV